MDREFAEVIIRALMMIVAYLRKRYRIGLVDQEFAEVIILALMTIVAYLRKRYRIGSVE